jgi:hypothetical protein
MCINKPSHGRPITGTKRNRNAFEPPAFPQRVVLTPTSRRLSEGRHSKHNAHTNLKQLDYTLQPAHIGAEPPEKVMGSLEALVKVLKVSMLLPHGIPRNGFTLDTLESSSSLSRFKATIRIVFNAVCTTICPEDPALPMTTLLSDHNATKNTLSDPSKLEDSLATLNKTGNRETRLICQAVIAKTFPLYHCQEFGDGFLNPIPSPY